MILSKPERREFLEERRRGVGGSDVAAVCGFHPYRDAMDVYLEKTRPVRPEDVEIEGQNIHLWRGIILENPLRELFEHLYNRPIQQFRDGNLKVHPDHDWVRAHLDGRQVSTGDHPFETTGAFEAKAPSKHGFRRIVESGLERYRIAQIHWELFASGYEWGTVAIGNLEDDQGPMIKWDVEPNEALIARMHERAQRFWFDHVQPREAPDPEEWGRPERVEMPDLEEGERREIEDPEMVQATYRLMKAYLIRNQAKDLYERRKDEYQSLMEERQDVAVATPLGKVNWKWRSGRTSFDREKLEKARPLDPDKAARLIFSVGAERIAEASIDDLADALVEGAEIDLSAFEEQYDDYRAFRPFPVADDLERLKAMREGLEGEGD